MMFRSACEHMTSVTMIHFLIHERMSTFELMDKKLLVAYLLWTIFVDAKAYVHGIRRTSRSRRWPSSPQIDNVINHNDSRMREDEVGLQKIRSPAH